MTKKVANFFQENIGVTPSVAARVTPTLVTPLKTGTTCTWSCWIL